MSGRFNLGDYVTVGERIDRYWELHPKPEGSIQTEIVWVSNDGNSVAIRATVYQGDRILATGIAQEERLDGIDQYGKPLKGVNATSWWENAETSAIGRAIANMGMSLSKQRPSRQEMEKVERYEAAPPAPARNAAPAFATPRAAPAPAPANPTAPSAGIAAVRNSASSTTPQAAEYDDALDWTAFWKWARPQGYHSKADMAKALGKADSAINDWTPAQLRTALEVAHQHAG